MANKRLIDGNAIDAICRTTKMIDVFPHWEKMSIKERAVAIKLGTKFKEIIQNAPTVDAVEVVHGRWMKLTFVGEGGAIPICFRCSKCITTWDAESNYCPNCGAKMDGGNEDGNGNM